MLDRLFDTYDRFAELAPLWWLIIAIVMAVTMAEMGGSEWLLPPVIYAVYLLERS